MQDNIITWNMTNWLTIVLMALGGFALLAVVTGFVKSKRAVSAPAQQVAQ